MADLTLRPAACTPRDGDALARLIALAGEGLPQLAWAEMAEPGESIWDVGQRRALREEGSFSYRNAVLAEADGTARGVLVSYPLAATPEPWAPEDIPALFLPLQELEDLAAGSWYVMVLAVFETDRGRGIGAQLLAHAEELAKANGIAEMSLIVRDENRARRLYERCGYTARASRPIVRDGGWDVDGQDWVLMVKPL